MEKNKFHAVIKHLHMKSSAPAFATVYNWVNEFKRGRTSTCDAPRSGRPIEAAISEIIDEVHDIVLTDRRVKVRELFEATGISHGTVISILHEQLSMKKLSARWVLRSTCDAPRSERPIEAAMPKIIDKVHDIVLTDRVKVRELVEATGISHSLKQAYFEGLDKSILSDGLKKLKNRWIKCIELKGDYVEK
ncbi:GVQW3 protein, partial [Acromyrmex heyeri]